MDNFSLDDVLNNDPLDVFKTLKVKNPIVTPDDRLIESFEEINQFYEDNGCEPKRSVDMNEIALAGRLSGIRKNQSKINMLKKYDTYNLLKTEETIEFNSIEDIFNNDDLGIFNQEQEDIFTLKNVPKIDKERAEADFVARRKKCKNFQEYENLFIECQKDLKDGKRKLVKFNEQYFQNKTFFVLKGVLLYLENIDTRKKDKYNKIDARTTTIFENGTESNMFLRSLGKGLYEDGYFVSEHEDRVLDELHTTKEDIVTGYIYILESLSNDDRILTKKDLYKIGFSTTDVQQRIKNAKNDPTYLMADVKIIDVYEVSNANPHKLEQLIHRFFTKCCLDIDIVDSKGDICKPREWFTVPLPIIEESIELIINGKIIDFYYDEISESITPK